MEKKNRSTQIPPINSPIRSMFLSNIYDFNDYKEKIKKGYPIFTKDELERIVKRYTNRYEDKSRKLSGLTWEDIEKELLSKNIILKKATFRKYIQEGNLPKSIGYVTKDHRRFALFPKDIVSHINFLHYVFKVASTQAVDIMSDLVEENHISYLDAIESKMEWYDNLWAGIYHAITQEDWDIEDAVKKVLSNYPEDREKIIKMIDDIADKFDSIINSEITKLENFLKSKKISLLEISD